MDKEKNVNDTAKDDSSKTEELEKVKEASLLAGLRGAELAEFLRRWEKEE